MAKKTDKPADEPAPASDPLIRTLAEIEAMTPAEQQAFRAAGGTSIQTLAE